MSNTGEKCITYIHRPRLVGWLVRVQWRKKRLAQWCPRIDYLFDEAIEIRDQLERRLGKPRTRRRILSSSNPDQGITHRRPTRHRKIGQYIVRWAPTPRTIRSKTFSYQTESQRRLAMRRARVFRLGVEKLTYRG